MIFDVAADAQAAVAGALSAIELGECIVLPTDTVYGIGADALQPAAVQALLDAKQRGRDMPPPVLAADAAVLRSLAAEVTEPMMALAEAFWPGALTLVVVSQPSLRFDLGDRGQTIALRVPDHGFARELLRSTGPLAVSSANVSGHPPATTIEQAQAQLGDSVSVYLDAGPASSALPSTIVDLTGPTPRILREGVLSRAELAAVVPELAAEG